ncbi:MAG: glycosyltransferase family 2 protein [Candidatus Bathyarchaeia archaeon]
MSVKEKLKVAVLVINYNGKHYLRECFESLKNQTYSDYDVYVIDNGSVDGSVEYVKMHFPWVKIIAFRENLGFAKAYNEAIKVVDADFVALLNNDTRVDKKWLQELVSAILSDNLITAVGSKILLYDNPQLLNHAGAKITPAGGGFDIGLYQRNHEKYDKKREVGAVCGAAMLVRKNLFMKIGGFDENFFAYFEDVDFCWRALLYGFKILYVPTSIVYHKLGGSWGRSLSPERVFLGERNRLLSVIKNFGLVNLIKALLISIPYNIIRIILFVRVRCGVSSIFSADLWILRNMGKIIHERRIIQGNRAIYDRTLFEHGFIASIGESIQEFFRLNLLRKCF